MTTNFKELRSHLEGELKRLTEERDQAHTTIDTSEARREGSPFGKREEEATESFELEKRLALDKQLGDRIQKLERALHKLDEGTYGLCDICGRPIAPARLEALPDANLCMDCKAKDAKSKTS